MSIKIKNKYILRYINENHAGQELIPIAGDASGRRFYRTGAGETPAVVIMDYGKPFQDPTDDLILTRIFQDAGLPVAGIVHTCPEGGFLVMDDLGGQNLSDRMAGDPGAAEELYEKAVDLLVQLAVAGTSALERSGRNRTPALDRNRFRFEMEYFLEHYYCGFLGQDRAGTQFQPLNRFVLNLADQAAAVEPKVLCHRDFHSRNLVVSSTGSLSMVDIQDGRLGPLGYDLASLLWDAYVDIEASLREKMIGIFREKTSAEDGFEASLRILAIQRMVKALGTFGYQISVLGRERYRSAIPRTLDNIRDLAINIPALRPILDDPGR